jgi:hypothetical protein
VRTRDELHQLELVPMTRDSWRVCDRAVASSDARSIVAYVEQRAAGVYDVVWVVAGIGVETFTRLEDVLRAAAELLSGQPRPRSRRRYLVGLTPSEPAV